MQRRVDGIHHPVQCRVMRHVADARNDKQFALQQFIVQPHGLGLRINHQVVFSSNDRDRQHKFAVAFGHRIGRRHHEGGIFCIGAQLHRPQHHFPRDDREEIVWQLSRRKHALGHFLEHEPARQRRDRVAHHIAQYGQGDRRGQQGINAQAGVEVAAHQHQAAHVFRVRQGHGHRHHRAHRVTNDHRPLDAQAFQRRAEQIGLRRWCPEPIARSAAVAETGPVEGNHAVIAGQPVHQAAGDEVRMRHGIAMDQHDRRAFAALDVVQVNAVNVDEAAGRRVVALGPARPGFNPRGGGGRTCHSGQGDGAGAGHCRGFCAGTETVHTDFQGW